MPNGYIPGLGVDLLKLMLVDGYWVAVCVEDEAAGAGRAVIDGGNEGRHFGCRNGVYSLIGDANRL